MTKVQFPDVSPIKHDDPLYPLQCPICGGMIENNRCMNVDECAYEVPDKFRQSFRPVKRERCVMQKSIVLLSGGLDSCVSLAIAREETDVSLCLTFHYSQRHSKEVMRALNIAYHYGLQYELFDLESLGEILEKYKASALTSFTEALPTERAMSEMTARVPRTYVPGRNTILLSIAQSVAEAIGADFIYTGFNAVDFSGYPDCRPIFVSAWNGLARVATKRGYENNPIEVRAPLINWAKASIIKRGIELNAPLHLTWSCYAGRKTPCGVCDSCIIRANGFKEVGIDDPALARS